MKIFIDAGHGGCYSGAVSFDGTRECDINLIAAKYLEDILTTDQHEVAMTRREDRDFGWEILAYDLQARCDLSNTFKPDCFISLHCNSFTAPQARGFEIWTSLGLTDADSLAEQIYMQIDEMMDISMRSDTEDGDHDREKHLYVLDHTKAPAVLLEMGFMSNPDELNDLKDGDHIKRMMNAVAKAIELWGVLH